MANDRDVLLVVAFNGYQQIEYGEPKKLLTEAGFNVVTASNEPGAAIAKDGSTTEVQVTLKDVKVNDYAGIFFIGGPGALENLDNEQSYSIVREAAKQHLPLGAICVSTRILAQAGVLKGRRATGWDGDDKLAEIYKEYGVDFEQADVV